MKNIICAVLLLALAGLIFYRIRSGQRERAAAAREGSVLQSPLRGLPVERLRETLRAEYRLRPDRRWLLAIAGIHALLTGEAKGVAEARFQNQQWEIYYKGSKVGSIPELPAYSDLMRLCVEWSRTNSGSSPRDGGRDPTIPEDVAAGIEGLLSPGLIRALESANQIWEKGGRSPELVRLSARALVLLTIQWTDSMEVGDELPGQAIALLAVAKSMGTGEPSAEECLLAEALGYHTSALEIARDLNGGSPERQYVLAEDDSLRDSDGTIARYLWLLRLRQKMKWDELDEWATRYFPGSEETTAIVAAGLSEGEFGRYRDSSELLLKSVFREVQERRARRSLLERARSLFDRGARAYADAFESSLFRASRTVSGPLFDRESFTAYYRGLFYTGLYGKADHLMNRLGSVEAAHELLDSLGEPQEEIPRRFNSWYGTLIEFHESNPDPKDVVRSTAEAGAFGLLPIGQTYWILKDRTMHDSPLLSAFLRLVIARLDTRPQHAAWVAIGLYSGVYDVRMRDKLGRHSVDSQGDRDAVNLGWLAASERNMAKLEEIVHRHSATPTDQALLLSFLEDVAGQKDETLRREYQEAIAMDPDSWGPRSAYADFLVRQEEYALARSVVEPWHSSHDSSSGFDYINACNVMATCYCREERFSEALAVIEPVTGSMQAEAVLWTARALDGLGRKKEAEECIETVVKRYPDYLSSYLAQAAFCWRNHRLDEAARVLKDCRVLFTRNQWEEEVAPVFHRTYRERPPEEPLAAFTAMAKGGIGSWELRRLARGIAAKGMHEAAFKIVSQLSVGGPDSILFVIDGYRFMKAWRSKAEALDWARTREPTSASDLILQQMLEESDFELLWEFTQPAADPTDDLVWLMRAAASAWLGPGRDPHRKQLLDHYANARGKTLDVMGRYMLGLIPEQEMLADVPFSRQPIFVAYWFGLRKRFEGDYEAAHDWFRITVEIGTPEYTWYQSALSSLYLWQKTGRSWAYVKANQM